MDYDIDEIVADENEKARDTKIEGYIDEAKENILNDKDLFAEIRDRILEEDNEYLSKILGSKYSKIEISKNKSSHIELRGTLDLDPKNCRLVDLKENYPDAEITIINHKGVQKVIRVTEILKFDKNN